VHLNSLFNKSMYICKLIEIKILEKESVNTIDLEAIAPTKMQDYVALGKLRLSSLVVFSAVIGFFLAVEDASSFNVLSLVYVIVGGFLVTASANALNQVWEKDLDLLMDRTKNRPIASGRLSTTEGFWFAILTGLTGEAMLFQLNIMSGILGFLAIFLYVFVYTPLKTVSPIAVFVGAFPGSIPPMLGYIAVTGEFGVIPGILFLTQFFWQFPHFWAIAWKINDDYKKAGFKMLPYSSGRSKKSAFLIFFYAMVMLPVGVLPCLTFSPDVPAMDSVYALIILAPLSLVMIIPALKLYKTLEMKYAKQLMFASFIYLPVAQISYLIFKL